MTKFSLTCSVALLLASSPVLAGGSAVAGKEKAATCVVCHGDGGLSTIPSNPVLAGQQYSYLVHALKAYRSGARSNPMMTGVAANLSDQDIADLSLYFSRQEGLITEVD